MSYFKLLVSTVCGLTLAGSAFGSESPAGKPKLNILKGPAKAQLESIAQIDVPSGYAFLDGKSTRAIMKASGEPTSGHELGFLQAHQRPLVRAVRILRHRLREGRR